MDGDISAFLLVLTTYPTFTYPEDLYLNNNHLYCSTNPQKTKRKAFLDVVFVQDNNLTFNGLEFLSEMSTSIPDYNKNLDSQAVLHIHMFNNGLAVSAGGTLSNNTYVWHTTGTNKTVIITGDSTFQPSASGKYYATITNSVVPNVTLQTDTITYNKNPGNCTPMVTNELKISISPNPVRGMIQISGLNDKANAKIILADMSGYVWMSTMTRNRTMLQLDVSRLKPGNYLINVNDEKGAVKTIQFIKE